MIAAACAIVASALSWAAFGADSPSTQLGRELFEHGRGRDGRAVIGRVAAGTVPMQGAAVACANCHGARGGGGAEAWIAAPDIRWFALSKPYGARRAGGEARPPYDRESLERALRAGVAPDGVPLDPAMPRFDLADDEIDALLAHLARLSDETHRDEQRPALVVLVPRIPAPAAERLLQGLQNCPTAPAAGTAPARTLPALRVVRYDSAAEADALVADMARSRSAAALLAPYLIGIEDAFARAATGARVPMLLPMALRDLGDARTAFALPGLRAQAQALIAPPSSPQADGLALAVAADMPSRDALVRHLHAVAEGAGWRPRAFESVEAALAAGDVDAVLALADPGMPPETLSTPLRLWVPAAFVVPERLTAWSMRGAAVRIALPYAPSVGDDPRWIPPADAWVAAGCELLAHLPPLPQRSDDNDAWWASVTASPDLVLGDWIRLRVHSDADEDAARAYTSDWPPASR